MIYLNHFLTFRLRSSYVKINKFPKQRLNSYEIDIIEMWLSEEIKETSLHVNKSLISTFLRQYLRFSSSVLFVYTLRL